MVNWMAWKRGIGKGKIENYHRRGDWIADKDQFFHLVKNVHFNDLLKKFEEEALKYFGENYEVRVAATKETLKLQYRRIVRLPIKPRRPSHGKKR